MTDAGATGTAQTRSRAEQIAAAKAAAAARGNGVEASRTARPVAKSRFNKTQVHKWLRLTHVYIGMFSMLAVLFFATTGLLLNNPTWRLGTGDHTSSTTGTVPDGVISTGTVDYLAADQFFRNSEGVKGDVVDYGDTSGQAHISYKNPGYSAYADFDTGTGAYTVTVTTGGLIATLNDVHTGNNTGSMWTMLINVVAIALIVIALSGLSLQFFLRKRRISALSTAGAGIVLLIGVVVWVVLT